MDRLLIKSQISFTKPKSNQKGFLSGKKIGKKLSKIMILRMSFNIFNIRLKKDTKDFY